MLLSNKDYYEEKCEIVQSFTICYLKLDWEGYWILQFRYREKSIDLKYQCQEVLYNNSMVCNPKENCRKWWNLILNHDNEHEHKK